MVVKKLKEGQYVWVKDASIAGTDLYTKGHILGINGNKARLARARAVRHRARVTLGRRAGDGRNLE